MNNTVDLQDLYPEFIVYWLFILIGAAILYATWRRVKFFVDPSADMPFGSSGVVLKKLLGGTGFRIYWYVFGGLCFLQDWQDLLQGFKSFFLESSHSILLTTAFTDNPNNNLLTVTDAKSQQTVYTPNNMNRTVSRRDPLLRTETYTYDNNGNLATVLDRK